MKCIAFDVDGTLIKNNLWQKMQTLFGVSGEQDYAWYMQYKHNEITYREWMEVINAVWATRQVKRSELESLFHTLEFNLGVEETIAELHRRGYETAVISSGLDVYVHKVATELSISHAHFFTTFEYDNNDYFKKIDLTSSATEAEEKVLALKKIEEKLSLQPSDIVFVGDSKNDLLAFEHTGRGVLYGEGNADLQKAAWKRISHMGEILEFLD